jgi:aromatic-L-amino-acid decarboxylase
MNAPSMPLDPAPESLPALVDAIARRVVLHHQALPHMKARDVDGGDALAARLRERAPPEEGAPLDALLDVVFTEGLSKTFNTASGGYLAYIPGGGLPSAALADFIASSVNRYTGVWIAAPGLVELEQNALRFIASLAGLPSSFAGVLTSGGSIANLAAVVAARHARLGERFDDGVLYTSSEAHHSVDKAARIAGFRADQVRKIPIDDRFRADAHALDAQIARDRRAGHRPFLVVAHAGTTNTGAIDPLHEIADLCAREDLWLHVDAAYGGFFAMTERGRLALDGIARADTVTLDPHKGLFMPYGTGCLLAKDTSLLKAAHDVTGAYMPSSSPDPEHVDFASLSPELSRPFRGLAVWLALKLHGARAFRDALDLRLDMARDLAARLARQDGVRIVAPPELSLFPFVVDGRTPDETDQKTARVIERVNARGRVFMTTTRVGGRTLARACVLHLRTDSSRIDACVEDMERALADENADKSGDVHTESSAA